MIITKSNVGHPFVKAWIIMKYGEDVYQAIRAKYHGEPYFPGGLIQSDAHQREADFQANLHSEQEAGAEGVGGAGRSIAGAPPPIGFDTPPADRPKKFNPETGKLEEVGYVPHAQRGVNTRGWTGKVPSPDVTVHSTTGTGSHEEEKRWLGEPIREGSDSNLEMQDLPENFEDLYSQADLQNTFEKIKRLEEMARNTKRPEHKRNLKRASEKLLGFVESMVESIEAHRERARAKQPWDLKPSKWKYGAISEPRPSEEDLTAMQGNSLFSDKVGVRT